jgi:ABC-type branched-subunit amino acid transport system substrate-binding protein
MLQLFQNSRRKALALVGLAVCASALAIGGASALAAGGKGPLVIMVATGDQNAILNTPEVWAGAEAAILRVNKTSPVGIHGQKLKILTCNTGGANTDAVTACARQAIAANAIAFLSPAETFTADAEPLLNSAHIPLIGTGSSADEQTLPNSFPLGGGSAATFGANALYWKYAKKVSNVAVLTTQTAPALAGADLIRTVIQRIGDNYAGLVTYPLTAQDFTPYAQQIKATGATGVIIAASGVRLLSLIQAMKQIGYNPLIGACTACISTSDLQKNAAVMNGVYLSGSFPPANANIGGMAKFRADAAAALKRGVPHADNPTDNMVQAWLAMQALAQVGNQYIPKGTAVTGASMVAALSKAKNVKVQGLVTWSPAGPGITQGINAPRITNGVAWVDLVQPDGTYTLQTPKGVDVFKAAKMTAST